MKRWVETKFIYDKDITTYQARESSPSSESADEMKTNDNILLYSTTPIPLQINSTTYARDVHSIVKDILKMVNYDDK